MINAIYVEWFFETQIDKYIAQIDKYIARVRISSTHTTLPAAVLFVESGI